MPKTLRCATCCKILLRSYHDRMLSYRPLAFDIVTGVTPTEQLDGLRCPGCGSNTPMPNDLKSLLTRSDGYC